MKINFIFLVFTLVFVACIPSDPPPAPPPKAVAPAPVATAKPAPPIPPKPPTGGPWETFHPNGTKATACRYVAGKISGAYREWYPNGSSKVIGSYRAGLRHGDWSEFDEKGDLTTVQNYSFGLVTNTIQDSFLDLIRQQQARNVGESCGEWAHQCFTDKDLAAFRRYKVAEEMCKELRSDHSFIALVLAIKSRGTPYWAALQTRGKKTFKKTWKQMGRISCAGQTTAGQTAEKIIATSIVRLSAEMLNQSSKSLENKLSASD